MISVEEARGRILAGLRPVGAETVPLAEGLGRVLAAAVAARVDQPPADVSAMDGYAVRAADEGARRVVGAAPAGHPFAGVVGPGEAVRLFTGSVVPAGADAVALQEDADRAGDAVSLRVTPVAGRHIRRRGSDFAAGQVLLEAGRVLGPRAIGLAAASNHAWLAVRRRPRVAILATGDEISLPGDPIAPGGVVSSNAHALAGLVRVAGGEPIVLPIAPDTVDSLAGAADASAGADLLVTSGGASVGEHDLVQAGLGERGFALDFWQIAMRPGKPLIFGRLGATPVLGLPGNPVSSLICGLLFVRPAVQALLGMETAALPRERAVLGAALPANDKRADHLRASLGRDESGALIVTPFGTQDSSQLRLLAEAGALIVRAPFAGAAAAGSAVEVIRLEGLF